MKLKKTILYLLTLLLIPLVVTFSICLLHNDKNDIKGLLIGNNIENVNVNYSYDDTFTSSFMDSSYLLKMIKNDASKEIDNKIVKLSTLIKKSNFVIINIGLVDIESLININENENKLIYDEEILYQKSEVLISNLKQIIDLIYDYNDKIGLFINKLRYNYYTNDAIVINLYKNINNLYEQVAIKKGATLIS